MFARYRYPKASRLRHRRDIQHAIRHGMRVQGKLFIVYALANNLTTARLGVTVSRRVSLRAVDRNRLKRLVRETFRHEQNGLKGLDIVVLALPSSRQAEAEMVRAALRNHWADLKKRCAACS